MNFALKPEHQQLYDRARELAVDFGKRARDYDERAAFPKENFEQLREAGFLNLTVPREMGGHGLWGAEGYLAFYLVLEALAAGCSSTSQLLQIHCHSVGNVAWLANREQSERIIGDVVRDGALIASGGNILPAIATGRIADGEGVLRPKDGGFELSYTSGFASLGPVADYIMVFALAPGTRTVAEGYTMAVIPKDAPGMQFIDTWDVMGMRATVSWTIKLEDVFIPWEDVVGNPGDLIQLDPRTWTLGYAANYIGVATGVIDFVRDYLVANPWIVKDDVVAMNFGTLTSRLQAARASMWFASSLWEAESYDEAEQASLRAMHEAKEIALLATTKAFDICGGRVGDRKFPLDRALRDARLFTVHTRESSLMRLLTEAELGGDFHSKQQFGPKLGPQSWDALKVAVPSARTR